MTLPGIPARRFRTLSPLRVAAPAALALVAAASLVVSGCGGGDSGGNPPPSGDDIAPAAVTDLYVRAKTTTTATVTWTAPGDDGATGVAAQYDLRWATVPLTETTWDAANVASAPPPAAPGTREVVELTGLPTGATCWFGLRTADEAPNWSGLSNVRATVPSAGGGRTWRVTPDGLGDAPTIQAAIDSAQQGDLVLVADGLYTWDNQGTAGTFTGTYGLMAFLEYKRNFTVRSESGPGATIIDCQQQGRGIYFQGNPTNTTNITVEGFTVRNGRANDQTHYAGGGLYGHLSACTFRDCVFEDCEAFAPAGGDDVGAGGGVWYGGVSAPVFEHCVFRRNRATLGGGVLVVNSSGESFFRDCVFTENRAESNEDGYGHGAAFYAHNFRFTMENCLLVGNTGIGNDTRGGGIGVSDDELPAHPMVVRGCTIADNSAVLGGGVNSYDLAGLTVESCIVAFNRNGGAFVRGASASLSVGCTDAFGNTGGSALPAGTVDEGGNFALDPGFCDRAAPRDYHLQSASPCAPGNHPTGAACGLVGALGVSCGAR